MKKIINSLLILTISLFVVSCTKTPFKVEKPLSNSALVYVYVMPDDGINDTNRIPYYEVKINGKSTDGKIYPYEFLKYNLDANSVNIDAIRNDIEKKSIKLELTRGKAHYLRVRSYSDGFSKFDFELIPNEQALKEIKNTKYAISENSGVLDILVTKEKAEKEAQKEQSIASKTKIQKIKEAHKLKEDGIITDQEFQKLKAEIINAN